MVKEEIIGFEGMRIDRMFFEKFVDVIRANDTVAAAVEGGQWARVIDYINHEVFDKPEEYYTLDKLRKAAAVDRRVTLREILEKVFGLIPASSPRMSCWRRSSRSSLPTTSPKRPLPSRPSRPTSRPTSPADECATSGGLMSKRKKTTIEVQGTSVVVLSQNQQDIICLTDIAKFKNPEHPDDVIRNWLRSRNTVEFLGLWERLNNPRFNPVEFDGIRIQTGLNSFVLTPKQWTR